MFDSLATPAEERRVSLSTEVASGISVRADRRRLAEMPPETPRHRDQVIPQGGSVRCAPRWPRAPDESGTQAPREVNRGQTARIEIEDTGEGIPAESLDRISTGSIASIPHARARPANGAGPVDRQTPRAPPEGRSGSSRGSAGAAGSAGTPRGVIVVPTDDRCGLTNEGHD